MRKWWAVALVTVLALGAWAQVRRGAWVDEVVFTEEPTRAKGIDMLIAGAIDIYAFAIPERDLVKKIIENLHYAVSYGSYNELTFNPYGPEFKDGRLNPFYLKEVREAVNWLIDRDYIVQEFYGGVGAVPRYLAITPSFPDYARLAATARALELKYAPNPEKAKAVIFEKMKELGAELKDGKWYYKGAPVVLKFLIRVEDERRLIGDYVATLFEKLGFEIERMYKTAREASPLWIGADPADGTFHVYTGGWVTTAISRDQGGNFDFFYTKRGRPDPLWQAYKPDPEFDQISERLARRDFKSIEERNALLARALELSMKDSVRVWCTNLVGYNPMAKNVRVAADLAGGVYGAWLWSRTVHFIDPAGKPVAGGKLRIAQPSMLTEPWNAIAGTNWIFDMMIIRGVSDYDTLPDPYTGLYYPQLVERAEVVVEAGLPVTKTLDWVDLKFVPKIEVPGDAWADWDPVNQRFITAAERFPGGTTAKTKVVAYFPANLYERLWHDGTKWSLADGLLGFILTFERGKPESAIYDEAAKSAFDTFMRHFKGLRILSEKPLVFEVYSDLWYLDAEWIAAARTPYLMPQYSQGVSPWHVLALGIQAEAAKELAFSSSKARRLGVEWMNYLAGPSLTILTKYLNENLATGYVPYANVLGKYVSKDEAIARYQALKKWYEAKGHLWVANGPLYVDVVKPVEKVVVLKNFEAFADPATKWLVFAEPKIAEVEVSAPAPVLRRGAPWDFLVEVTYKDQPYPVAEIDFVTYLLFDAEGNLVLSGKAEAVKDGLFAITIDAATTAKLPAGSIRLEVAVASKVVAIPSFATATFTVL
ncbi:MAG: ABC transporter substrate-binding protein [Candidatus Bipolaricaulota bacterium]|nr:ABC transporter substrate-binding protein [Candidatus Bipolaricaulota bacterium]MDW8151867.1 ABC transporter substrate-binding protein [Candidatus Bipolaricaulota bacterium]